MNLSEWLNKNNRIDQDVADAIGVTRSYANRIRRGVVHPSLGTALAIHEYTGGEVDLRQLLPIDMRSDPVEPPRPRGRPLAHPRQAAGLR